MDIYIKPILDANYPNDDACINWVVYQSGKFAKPEMILRDTDIKRIVDEYCAYHKIKIDL